MKKMIRNSISALFMAATVITVTGMATPVTASPVTVSSNAVSAETAANYTTSGTTLTVAATNGSDITAALNETITKAASLASADKFYTVKVPAGSYTIKSAIQMQSNLILDLYDVNITSAAGSSQFSMLILGDAIYTASAACKGYEGFENITIMGGTFTAEATHVAAPIRLMHANNVTLKDVTVGGGNADHLIETAALQNFLVDGCTLQNMSITSSTDNQTREALQLDLAVRDSIYPFCYHDGTMMRNVTIQNCTFNNVSRGLGGHSLLLNAYHENIKIINNTFVNVREECIVAGNYRNCEISGNTMTDCGSGIVFQYSKSNDKTIFTTIQNGTVPFTGTFCQDAETVIKNNTINLKYTGNLDAIAGIKLYGRNIETDASNSVDGGTIPAGDYYVSGVEVSDNTITTAGYGIVLQDAKDCVIKNNKITGTGYNNADKNVKEDRYHGILAGTSSSGNTYTENTILNVLSNGIQIQDHSDASRIASNIITSPGNDGISIFSGTVIVGDIASNTISGAGDHGISFNNASTLGSICDNRISNSKMSGINIFESSVIGGNITGNTISDSAINGINIGGASSVKGNVASNTISVSDKNGIQIISDSNVSGNIEANIVSDSKTGNGISVINDSSVYGSITENTVTGSKKIGINVYNKSSVNGNIENNTVKTSTEVGIRVGARSVLGGSVLTNNVSDSKKSGIQVSDKSTVTNKIASNTVTNSTQNGIYVTTGSKVNKGIESNTIKKAKKYGIYVYGKSTVKESIIGNKISSCDTAIVTIPDCTVAIRKNTMSKNKNNVSRIATTSIQVKSLKAAKFSSASGKGKKITLKWNKVSGVSGYYVELSTTADFKKISKKIDTTSTNGVFKKLKKGKTYYVRISAYKKSGKARIYSNYSKVKKIKVS